MPGVQGFVDQRQQAQKNSCRQVGNGLKVPVPQTKLEHSEQRSLTPKPSKSLIPGYRSANEHGGPLDFHLAQTSNVHGDGFDTDAEGLDDTTIMSGDYNGESQKGSAPAISIDGQKSGEGNGFALRPHHPFLTPREQRHDNQVFGQFQGGNLAIEGNDESYEESGDEDDEEDEEDEEGNEDSDEHSRQQGSIEAELLHFHNNPAFSRYHQEDPDFFKQAAYQEVLETRTMCNIAVGEAGSKSPRTRNPLQSHGPSAGNGTAASDVSLHSRGYRQTPHGIAKQTILARIQQSNNASINPPANTNKPIALEQTVSVNRQLSQSPSATMFTPNITKPQSQKAKGEISRENGNAHGIFSVGSQHGTMLPPILSNDSTATKEKNLDRVRQLDNSQEAASLLNGSIGLDDDAFSAGEEPGMDDGYKMRPTAHKRGQKTQKRPRGLDLDLDYNQDQLSGMTFQQLIDEAFHGDHQNKGVELPSEIASGTLVQKLDYLVKLADYDDKIIQRGAFLASLPIEEYEECGELMIQRFGEVVLKFKNARQQRRKVVKEFEAEVAKREELVRGKIDSLEKDFDRLKRGGEDVVRKKVT